jgi:hypothetical protein
MDDSQQKTCVAKSRFSRRTLDGADRSHSATPELLQLLDSCSLPRLILNLGECHGGDIDAGGLIRA